MPLSDVKACVPVDGDTFDVPAIIETAETRRRVHGLPQAKFSYREKFGNDPTRLVARNWQEYKEQGKLAETRI